MYYNNGTGTLATAPALAFLGHIAFNGHLDVADVNGRLARRGGGGAACAGRARGQGVPQQQRDASSDPAWVSSVSQDSFGCAFGDVNATEGRICRSPGHAYNAIAYRNVVYLNTGGTLVRARTGRRRRTRTSGITRGWTQTATAFWMRRWRTQPVDGVPRAGGHAFDNGELADNGHDQRLRV